MARLDNMVQRILRTMLRFNLVNQTPLAPQLIDVARGIAVAQQVAEASYVLLKNNGVLPIPLNSNKKIAIFGSKADLAVLQGGGAARVPPIGGHLASVPTVSTAYVPYNN